MITSVWNRGWIYCKGRLGDCVMWVSVYSCTVYVLFIHWVTLWFLACLLANTRSTASLSSSSASILISSSRASFTRSLSLLSTTKIRPETARRTRGQRNNNNLTELIVFWRRRGGKYSSIKADATLWLASAHPVCFESSVSREGGSCPAHLRPTRWSWCSCTPPSPH